MDRVRAALLVALAACSDAPVFRCETAAQCQLDGQDGVCEATGWCSFEDPSCDGRRYTESAGDGLADLCIHTTGFGEGVSGDVKGVTTDAELLRAMPAMNFGGSDNLTVSGSVATTTSSLLRFVLTAIPTTATVETAQLRVQVIETGNLSVDLFAVVEPWEELAVTWNQRTSSSAWSTPGAGPGSRGTMQIGSFVAAQAGMITVALDPAAVQAWIADPSANHGLLLAAVSMEGATLASSQEGVLDQRPGLVITWH